MKKDKMDHSQVLELSAKDLPKEKQFTTSLNFNPNKIMREALTPGLMTAMPTEIHGL